MAGPGPFLLLLALAQAPPPAVSLVFGGDVIPHDGVKYVARQHAGDGETGDGWDQVLGPIAPSLRRGEVAVVNLESPVSQAAKPARGDRVFDAPPELLAGLKRAGVTVASFANNHALDQGRAGIVATRAALEAAGLLGVGAAATEAEAWQPLVVERHGLTVGFLAVTRVLNVFQPGGGADRPHVPAVPYPGDRVGGARTPAQLAKAVKAAAATVDALVVLVHWGEEYRPAPLQVDRALARQLVEAGALAVVGHHPHVLQPVEWVARADGTRGLVAYSLGNLVSNQSAGDAAGRERDGLLLELTVEKGPGGARVAAVGAVPLATVNRPGQGRARRVQTVPLEEELAAVGERLAALGSRDGKGDAAERKALTGRLKVEQARLARIQALVAPVQGGGAASASASAPSPREAGRGPGRGATGVGRALQRSPSTNAPSP